ncbi:hypothetical protein MRX96_022336 [Rhipicephalus microplus]
MRRVRTESGVITIDFAWISLRPITESRMQNDGGHLIGTNTNRYLPGVSLQTVVEQFEVSPKSEAKTYEEYVSELCRNIEMHKVCGGTRPARHHRKTWWDKEVAVARHARREANRSHRRAVRTKDAVQTEVAWQRYLQFKRDMQAH